MDSQELTGWMALVDLHQVEREEAEEKAKHERDSDDGEVIAYGKPVTKYDDEDDDPDGTSE